MPGALADTRAPVRGGATAEYQADHGAVLAEARAYDPRVRLDFAFERATLYEVALGAPLLGTRSDAMGPEAPEEPRAPAAVRTRYVEHGSLRIDPSRDAALLLLTDPRGLSLGSLPLRAPQDPSRLAVDAAAPLPRVPSLGPHELDLGGGLRYAIEGLLVDEAVRARAEGGVLAAFARGLVWLEDARGARQAIDLGAEPGERLLLVEAEGARVDLVASGLAAVLDGPQVRLGAAGEAAAELAGRDVGATKAARVEAGREGVGLEGRWGLEGSLLLARGSDAITGAQGLGPVAAMPGSASPGAVGAGALLGGAIALGAVGLAAAWNAGKHGLLALLAPLYARLRGDRVLESPAREAIYRFVTANPGVNVSDVVRRFGLGWGATVYHLRVLERAHLFVALRQGRQVCYFPNGGRFHGYMAGMGALRNPNAAAVARAVLGQAGLRQRDLCRCTGLAQPTVSWHLQRLEAAGLVAAEGGARRRYRALPALLDLAARGLLPGYAAEAPRAPPARIAAPTAPTVA